MAGIDFSWYLGVAWVLDRVLFYGYVDYNNYSKRYYFTKEENPESENFGKYVFVDQNGKEYTEDSEIDVTTNTILRPKYINAGYEAIEDKFGDYSLKMVYIPGTNGEKWIGDEPSMPTWRSFVPDINYPWSNNENYTSNIYENTSINKADKYRLSTSIPNHMASNNFLTREFMYNLIYRSGVCTVNGAQVTVKNGSTNTVFTFSSDSILKSGASQGLYGYSNSTYKIEGWNWLSYCDVIVACNMLTAIWNATNPTRTKLTYAYFKRDNNGNHSGNVFNDATYRRSNNFSDPVYYASGNTGYRTPELHSMANYWSHLITDERQLCYENIRKPSGYDYPLSYSKDELGLSYAYKNSYDGNTTKTSYYGSAAGLAWYNEKTGTYDRNRLRLGYEAMGRTGIEASKTVSRTSYDINERNGCGLYWMSGRYFIVSQDRAGELKSSPYPNSAKTDHGTSTVSGSCTVSSGYVSNSPLNGDDRSQLSKSAKNSFESWAKTNGNRTHLYHGYDYYDFDHTDCLGTGTVSATYYINGQYVKITTSANQASTSPLQRTGAFFYDCTAYKSYRYESYKWTGMTHWYKRKSGAPAHVPEWYGDENCTETSSATSTNNYTINYRREKQSIRVWRPL